VRDRLIADHKKLNTSRNCNENLIATLLICTARKTHRLTPCLSTRCSHSIRTSLTLTGNFEQCNSLFAAMERTHSVATMGTDSLP
jgi:hypothetical protein